MTQLSGLLEEFLEECEDILSDLEDALLILETQQVKLLSPRWLNTLLLISA